MQEPVQWPAFLPPFLEKGRFAPDGLLWIQRTTQADAPTVFDLVDPRGVVVRRVSTPAYTELVGFGRSHIYFVRLDADARHFLERYRACAGRDESRRYRSPSRDGVLPRRITATTRASI